MHIEVSVNVKEEILFVLNAIDFYVFQNNSDFLLDFFDDDGQQILEYFFTADTKWCSKGNFLMKTEIVFFM